MCGLLLADHRRLPPNLGVGVGGGDQTDTTQTRGVIQRRCGSSGVGGGGAAVVTYTHTGIEHAGVEVKEAGGEEEVELH